MSLPVQHLAQVAAAINVEWCRGILPSGHYCAGNHRKGFVLDGVVHMSERRLTREAIRRFLVMAAEVLLAEELRDAPPWESLYRRCELAETLAREVIRIRIPSRSWALDRWTVRAQLPSVHTDNPIRAAAKAWSELGDTDR